TSRPELRRRRTPTCFLARCVSRCHRRRGARQADSDLARTEDDTARNRAACFQKSRVVQSKEFHVIEYQPADVPQPKAGPLGIVVGPPSHAEPPSLFVYPACPCPAASIVPADNIGGAEAQRLKQRRIVQVTDGRIVRKVEASQGASAPGQTRSTLQNRLVPFGEAAKSFRDGSGRSIAHVQDRIDSRVIESASTLRRNVERAAWRVLGRRRDIWKDSIQAQHRGQAYAPSAIPSMARITGAAPSRTRTSMGRARPSSGSDPTSHRAAASRPYTRKIRVRTSWRSTIRRPISLPIDSIPAFQRDT